VRGSVSLQGKWYEVGFVSSQDGLVPSDLSRAVSRQIARCPARWAENLMLEKRDSRSPSTLIRCVDDVVVTRNWMDG